MRFSSQEIRQQKFKKKIRGLDTEDVEDFIQMVADDFDEFQKENDTLKNKIKDAKLEIEALQLEIETLQKSEAILKQSLAEKPTPLPVSPFLSKEMEMKGRAIILQAMQKARNLSEEAETKGRETILQARKRAKALKETAMNEAMGIEREINQLRGLKKQIEK